jgi:hypothetical protein
VKTFCKKSAYTILVEKHEGNIHMEDLNVDGRILKKKIWRMWARSVWLRT